MTLKEKIIKAIAQHGDTSIPFSLFMEMALYDKDFGYYTSQSKQFGLEGDFYTSSSFGDIFSKTIGNQFQECFDTLEKNIIEFGAGTGKFALDTIVRMTELEIELDSYLIIEKSKKLQEAQLELLTDKLGNDLLKKIKWIKNVPENFEGIIFANEVFDALPTNIFLSNKGKIKQRKVGHRDDGFIWIDYDFEENFDYKISLPESKIIFEYSPAYNQLFNQFQKIKKGVVLIVDYGMSEKELFHSQRSDGSIRSFYKNQITSNVLDNVGFQDITYNVNFTHLAYLTEMINFEILGYTNQSHFLNNLGLSNFVESGTSAKHFQDLSQVNMLTSPSEMGDLIKVMAISKQMPTNLMGFSDFDKTHTL